MSAFDDAAAIPPQPVWDRVLARAVHGERLTLAIVELEPAPSSPSTATTTSSSASCSAARCSFRVGDEERDLEPGGTWSIPPNVPHSATAGPDGATVIDVFAPSRDDWKEIQPQEPRPGRWP